MIKIKEMQRRKKKKKNEQKKLTDKAFNGPLVAEGYATRRNFRGTRDIGFVLPRRRSPPAVVYAAATPAPLNTYTSTRSGHACQPFLSPTSTTTTAVVDSGHPTTMDVLSGEKPPRHQEHRHPVVRLEP